MSVRQHKRKAKEAHTCPTCHTHFKGSFCPTCGEKVFHIHDLSLAHLTEHTIDIFTHFDLKIPKSMLLLFKPGYLTEQFLKGIRVPYAKPVQLFIIVNIVFFLSVNWFNFYDFTPSFGDHTFYNLSESYAHFRFLAPFEIQINDQINQLGAQKAFEMGSIAQPDVNLIYSEKYFELPFINDFLKASKLYSKSFIFLLVPLCTLLFFAALFKRFKYLGSAFIFSTHFISYYLLAFTLWEFLINKLSLRPMIDQFSWFLFDSSIGPLSRFFFTGKFEFINLIILIPWLFFAFKRLFHLKWYINLPISWLLARTVFWLTFGFYKKILTALTIWLM
jgi:hypothetical protein